MPRDPASTLKAAIGKKEIEVDALDREVDTLRDSVRRAEFKQAAEAAKLTYLKLHSVASVDAIRLADEVGQAVHAFDASLKPSARRDIYMTAKGVPIPPPTVVADDEIGYQDMDDYGDTSGVEANLEAALDIISSYRDAHPKESSNALSMLLLVTEAFLPLCLSHGAIDARAKSLSIDPVFLSFGVHIRSQLGYSFGAGEGAKDLLCDSVKGGEAWSSEAEKEFTSVRTEALTCSAFDEMLSSVLDEWASCIINWVAQNAAGGTVPPPTKCVAEADVLLQLVSQLLGPEAKKATETKIDALVREILEMD